MLIGNKIDLHERNSSARKVSKEQAEKFANENSILFEEISAKNNQNVEEIFELLFEEVYKVQKDSKNLETNQNHQNLQNQKPTTKNCC